MGSRLVCSRSSEAWLCGYWIPCPVLLSGDSKHPNKGAAHARTGRPERLTAIRLNFDLETDANEDQVATLLRLTERYCVVLQTLAGSPGFSVTYSAAGMPE